MKPFSLQTKIIAGVAIAIALATGAWFIHRDGVEAGQVDQKIEASAVSTKQNRAIAAVAQKAADAQVKKSDSVRVVYHAKRSKVEVKGDSVFADGQAVDMPSVASLIAEADSRGAQDSTTISSSGASKAAVDSLVSSLDGRVDLLQEAKRPRFGTKTGVAIGVVGTAAVVYIAVKIIRALAHR